MLLTSSKTLVKLNTTFGVSIFHKKFPANISPKRIMISPDSGRILVLGQDIISNIPLWGEVSESGSVLTTINATVGTGSNFYQSRFGSYVNSI